MKHLFAIVVSLVLALVGYTQQFDNPVAIPVSYYGTGATSNGLGGWFSFGQELGATTSGSLSSGYTFDSAAATAYMIPGKEYLVATVTCSGLTAVVAHFNPSTDYEVYINGAKSSGWALWRNGACAPFRVRIERLNDLATSLAGKRGGECSSLPDNKPIWYIGLGQTRNGKFAGSIGFRQATIDNSLFNTKSLICDAPDTSEVSVTRDASGYPTKVQSRDVVVAIDPYNASGTSYTIKVAQVQTPSTPFITYTVKQVAGGVKIIKQEDGLYWATSLTYSNLVWTHTEWRRADAAGNFTDSTSALVTTTVSSDGLSETVQYGADTDANHPAVVKNKVFVNMPWGNGQSIKELKSVTMGSKTTVPPYAPTTSYSYYTNSGGLGWAKALQWQIDPTGGWIRYDYHNADARAGLIKAMYRPMVSAPATPDLAFPLNSYCETYDYATNWDGTQSALASKVVTICGATLGQTTWTYNFGYATVNAHTIAQSVEVDRASATSSLTTTRRFYREDDSNSLFRGRMHSITRPDGTKDSYAYYTGTWSAATSSFAPGAGGDQLMLVFHGQTSAGTAVSSWTYGSGSWIIDTVNLVAGLSTVTEVVTDTYGHVVLSAENVYTGSGMERVSGQRFAYTANNLLQQQLDIIRSVPGVAVACTNTYEGGALKTTTAIDGSVTIFAFDNLMRLSSKTNSTKVPSSAFPSTVQSFTYTGANLKLTAQEQARSPVVTTYCYDSAGRITKSSVVAPGGGASLDTKFSYDSLTQTTETTPTNATKITNLYLDGRLCKESGTGVIEKNYSYYINAGYIFTKTQTGSTTANGWSEQKRDWIGRIVTERTPQFGWISGSNKVTCRTYSYNATTGKLVSLSTKDEGNALARLVPDHLYVYGNLGMLTQEGDDLNNSGVLDANSTDRMVVHNKYYFKDAGGSWLCNETSQTYATAGASALTTTGLRTTRLTLFHGGQKLGAAAVISDIATTDATGRYSWEQQWVDPVAQTLTRSARDQALSPSNPFETTWQNGYLESEMTPSGGIKTYAYYSSGLLQNVADAATNATAAYVYYPNTATIQTSSSSTGLSTSATTTFAYSVDSAKRSLTVSTKDAAANVAYTEYDALGRIWHTWGAAAQPTQTGYDAYGRQTKLTTWRTGSSGLFSATTWPTTPGTGDATTWNPDPATGLPISKTYANNSIIGFQYNALGQITKRTWARNVSTTYSYFDGSTAAGSILTGELRQISYSDGTPTVTYAYNRFGAVASVADATGTRSMDYRADLNLDSVTLGAFFGSKKLSSTYDTTVTGRLTGYNFNSGATASIFGFESNNGHLASVQGKIGTTTTTFTLGYATKTDWVNSVTNGSYSRSLTLVPGYNVMANVTTKWNGAALGNFTSKYDAQAEPRGLRTGQEAGAAAGMAAGSWSQRLGLGNGLATTFAYDPYGQLKSAPTPTWLSGAGSQVLANRNFGWSYDLAGNRTAETGAAATNYSTSVDVPANKDFGALNEYTSITGALAEAIIKYDEDGNLTQDGTWTYTYDGENRLTKMVGSGKTLTFVYDYTGRRVRKTVTGTATSDTKFLWVGTKLIAELNADGYTVRRAFVWGPDFSDAHGSAGGAGALLAQIDGTSISYAMPDTFGNIVGYLNSAGAVVAATEYSPYGRVINSSGSTASYPIGYSGQYTDSETGLVYYGARYYNPKHGRFVNRDPIEEQGGNNLYAFCHNNSTNRWDVLGMDDKEEIIGGRSYTRTDYGSWIRHDGDRNYEFTVNSDGSVDAFYTNQNTGTVCMFGDAGYVSPQHAGYYSTAVCYASASSGSNYRGAGGYGGGGISGNPSSSAVGPTSGLSASDPSRTVNIKTWTPDQVAEVGRRYKPGQALYEEKDLAAFASTPYVQDLRRLSGAEWAVNLCKVGDWWGYTRAYTDGRATGVKPLWDLTFANGVVGGMNHGHPEGDFLFSSVGVDGHGDFDTMNRGNLIEGSGFDLYMGDSNGRTWKMPAEWRTLPPDVRFEGGGIRGIEVKFF